MLDSKEIRRRLPHRYPLLLVDRVTEAGPERVLGEKFVTANEPFFRGHFPSAPVMPGVLLLESMFQLLWLHWGGEHGFHLCGVKRLKLRRSVVPGDVLELEAQVLEMGEQPWRFKCFGRVEGKVAVEGELIVRSRAAKPVQESSVERREVAKT
ncbi:MAG: 3-hydroxyacyl-ACP dehydratase FabZ [Vulcanimicrobiota bacterium]